MPLKKLRSAATRAAALALALSAAACAGSAPAGPVPALVPSDALAAAVVESPQGLYAAAKELWKAAKPRSAAGLDEALAALLPEFEAARDYLDFARPWAFALVPGDSGSAEERSLLFLPYRVESDFQLTTRESAFRAVARSGGYVVMSDIEGPVEFPPREALDLSRLARYPAASVKLWLDPAGLAERSKDGYRLVERAIRDFVAGGGRASPADAAADLALGFLQQIEAADAALIPGARGLELRAGASILPGGELAQAYRAAASAPTALDWANRLRPERLYSFAYSMDNAAAAELSGRLSQAALGALGMGGEALAGMSAFQARAAALAGPRGATSLDIDLDLQALSRLEGAAPPEIRAALSKALAIRLEAVQEARDEDEFAAFVRSIPTDPDLSSYLANYGRAFGIEMALEGGDRREGSFPYGEIRMRLSTAGPEELDPLADAESAAAIGAAFEALGDLMTVRWTTASGCFIATTGDATALRTLASTPAPGAGGRAADPAFAAYAAGIAGKPFVAGSVSARRLLELAAEIAELARPEAGGEPDALPDPKRFGSWYSHAATVEGTPYPRLELGLLAPASDVGAIYDAAAGGAGRATEPRA